MGVKEDVQHALMLAKQEKYIEARQLLINHDHPKAKELLRKVNKAILEQRNTSEKGISERKEKPTSNIIRNVVMAVALSLLVVCGGLSGLVSLMDAFSSDTDVILNTSVPLSTLSPLELTSQAIEITPLSPQIVNAEIAPRVRTCPLEECESVLVYQGEELQLLGRVDGMFLEGSTRWYQVLRDGQVLFVHEHSLYFGGPTPIVPTVNWRTEEAPVYYGNTTNSNSSSNNSNSGNSWNCSRDYDCRDFSSCSAITDYENSCPNNRSGLDGDNDGFSCEDRCP